MAKCLIVISLLLYFVNSEAQITVHDQRYQVENMPQPISISSHNHIPLNNETITISGVEQSYKHTYHRISGNLIPIKNNEKIIIAWGFGYATDQFQTSIPSIANGNEAIWTQLNTTGSIGQNYFWRGGFAYGSYSNGIRLKKDNTYKGTTLVQLGKKWNPNLATSIGALMLSNFGDTQILPVAQVSYSTGKFVFDFWLPIEVNIRYVKNKNFHILLQNTIGSRSYRYESDAFNYRINEISLRSEMRIVGVLWSDVAIVKPYGLKLENQSGKKYTEIGTNASQSISVQIGLFIRFQEND